MNNNQNANDNSSFGMLNSNQPVSDTQNNVTANQPGVINGVVGETNNVPQSNVVTLGTVSNVTYADTIGDIDYETPVENNDMNAEAPTDTFINNDYNETLLTDLNVEGTYNNMDNPPDYTTDPKVMANIHPEKKNTITIGKELKTFFIIALVLLVFIFLMPILADLVNKIRFH